MSKYGQDTGFLFAAPSFLQGFASALDLSGTLVEYNVSASVQEADARAIASDWAVIGKDIYTATEDIAEEKEAA
jgi:hypothetical protein